MKTGPRYKKARRLGESVFDKTQSQKYALRNNVRKEGGMGMKKKRATSDFGIQLIEKQRAKVTYGFGERQFKNLVEKILSKKGINITEELVKGLEMRLDNVIYSLGFAKTRQAARQMVNHGHINVNGKRMTIPSYTVSVGDVVTIRELSAKKALYKDLDAAIKEQKIPSWLTLDAGKKEAKVQGTPKLAANELAFDVSQIFQYYSK